MSKILVVDDNEINLKLLERIIMNNTSCEVITANNGNEALELVKNEAPFLVFMDMMMPGMDGYEATSIIKKDPGTATLPVVAVTAVNTKEGIKKVFGCGCEDILQKPISINTVVQLIEKYLKS
ncbi:MAG: hypothetical protein IEMM0008_0972 [bacterium]|nr:MAG: hypothetical protein IEMM0008_0972 [bacterium]